MDHLFKSINKDSAKCVITDYLIFAEQIYQELKELFTENYSFLPKKSSKNNKLYSLSEFIDLLIKEKIVNNFDDSNKFMIL